MATFADFPYEIVEASGENALALWEKLKKAGRGAPVVLGGDHLDNLLLPFDPMNEQRLEPVKEILVAAAALTFPDDLLKFRRDENARATASLKAMGFLTGAEGEEEDFEPPLGDWPAEPSYDPGLSVAYELVTKRSRPLVHIALIPTDDPTTIPAYMRWGNWNACPPPAYHVAALRAWRDRYGAELIGLGSDVINLRVARRPATREEALDLARVQHVYCNDIIDQGWGSYRAAAAGLMESDWWFFWWD
jgi:hypothetical protein